MQQQQQQYQLVALDSKQALQLFQPKPVTPMSIMCDPQLSAQIAELTARLEARVFQPGNRLTLFDNQMLTNRFNQLITEKIKNSDTETFNVNEWFNNLRLVRLPVELLNYDPNDARAAIPQYTDQFVDWGKELTDMELKYEGFITLLFNMLQAQDTQKRRIEELRYQQINQWTPTQMPAPRTTGPAPLLQGNTFSTFFPASGSPIH